ncbi:glucosaminidase domain-containing protein [Candidatus Puniceispirillum sp.]|nr:glucosaminidase domain-containing protein [Candidatus Puniceispirillum sp.]
MISSISNWLTNRRIVWIAAAVAFLGFTGPGLFGLSPPQFFQSHDAVTEQAKIVAVPSGKHLAPVIAPQATQPDASPAIVAAPKTDRDAADTTNATDGVLRDAPEQVLEKSLLAKAPKTLKEPNTSHIELEPTKRVPAPEPLLVPRDFFTQIPDSHLALSGTAQKESFIKIVLPLILASNEEISKRREAIKRAFENGDRATLEKWAKLYKIDVTDWDNKALMTRLLERANTIPVALALAQAAVESGWGTSRFAIQGNALFGQWAWRDYAGIRPLDASDDRAVVRSFGFLLGSVRAYMHNLNTHPHYQKFRQARLALRNRPKAGEAETLAKYLDRYAEIGEAYVTKLEVLIRSNDFSRFALAYLS